MEFLQHSEMFGESWV